MFPPVFLLLLIAQPVPLVLPAASASIASYAPAATAQGTLQTRFAWVDFDGDGFVDAFVIQPDGSGHLLHNCGDGSFEEQAERCGLHGTNALSDAAWCDYDGDGLMDLLLASHAGPLQLWRQTGDGTFLDVAVTTGLARVDGALAVEWRDLDDDGRADLRVSTATKDLVFLNLRDGSFVEVALALDRRVPLAIGSKPGDDVAAGRAPGSSTPGSVAAANGSGGNGASWTGQSIGQLPSAGPAGGICAATIDDQANPGTCIPASTVPILGTLYPMSTELLVDSATGWVGVNTLVPEARLHVSGRGRFQGDHDLTAMVGSGLVQVLSGSALTGLGINANEIQTWGADLLINEENQTGTSINSTVFVTTDGLLGVNRTPGVGMTLDVDGIVRASDTIISTRQGGAPFEVASTDVNPNLNADLLDGFDSSAFSQFGASVETAELADAAVTNAKVAFGILGVKIVPDFGAQVLQTAGRVILGVDYSRQFNLTGNGRAVGDWVLQGMVTADRVDASEFRLSTAPTAGHVLVSDSSGNGTWQALAGGGTPDSDWIISGSDMRSGVSGNVGIGTSTPDTKLNVSGGTDASAAGGGFLQIGNDTSSNVVFDSNEIMARFNGGATNLFLQNEGGDLKIFQTSVSGRVGIGTTNPLARLHVETMSGGTDDALRVRVDGSTKLIVKNDGSVGIGASSPNYPLHIRSSTAGDYAVWLENVAGDGRGLRVATSGSGVSLVAGATGSGDIFNGRNSTGLVCRVTNTGRFITSALEITGGGDLVEAFDSREGEVEPGSVMSIDPLAAGGLTLSAETYDTKVAGIVSGAGGVEHGILLTQKGVLEGDTLLAMTGRVWCKCSAENGPIRPGDRLTTASLVGYAMKATDEARSPGSVIGKAMTELADGKGLVLVLVNLQ